MNSAQVVIRYALWRRRYVVAAQNITDRLIGDVISQIGERPDNPVIAPGSIFLGHPRNQFLDFFVDWRSARASECSFGLIYVDYRSQRLAGTRDRRVPSGIALR
jgi:hypothetical protein